MFLASTPPPTGKPVNICDITLCDFGRCVEVNGTATCQCRVACPFIYSPVCGSNNKTYDNFCLLEAAACEKKEVITVKHDGRCSKYIPLLGQWAPYISGVRTSVIRPGKKVKPNMAEIEGAIVRRFQVPAQKFHWMAYPYFRAGDWNWRTIRTPYAFLRLQIPPSLASLSATKFLLQIYMELTVLGYLHHTTCHTLNNLLHHFRTPTNLNFIINKPMWHLSLWFWPLCARQWYSNLRLSQSLHIHLQSSMWLW